jgi:hypothetical protein
MQGEWRAKSAGGCLNHSSWRFNPQIFLTVRSRINLTIKLTQEVDEELNHIGFYVAKSDGTASPPLALVSICDPPSSLRLQGVGGDSCPFLGIN